MEYENEREESVFQILEKTTLLMDIIKNVRSQIWQY